MAPHREAPGPRRTGTSGRRPGGARTASATAASHEQTPRADGMVATRRDSPQTPKAQFSEKHVSQGQSTGWCPAAGHGHAQSRQNRSADLALHASSPQGRTPVALAPFPGRAQGHASKDTFQPVVICETGLAKIY